MAYNPSEPAYPENFFAVIDSDGDVVNLISYDEKEGMFERIPGEWKKFRRKDRSLHGMRIIYVSPEAIKLYDETYNYQGRINENQLEPYSTEASIARRKEGR